MDNPKNWALITGASGGIGSEFCDLLAKRGYNLILVGRSDHTLKHICKTLEEKYSVRTVPIVADLSVIEDTKYVCQLFSDYKVRLFISCAGMGYTGSFPDQPEQSMAEMIGAMVLSDTLLSRAFLSVSSARRLLLVSSVAGFAPDPYMAVYGSCKAYTNVLSRSLRSECKTLGLPCRVSLLAPGPVSTDFDRKAGCTTQRKGQSPQKCAQKGIDGLFKGKVLIFSSLSARICFYAMKFLPEKLMTPVISRIQRRKIK